MFEPERFQQRFFARLESSVALAPLFDYLPEVYLYVKDRKSRFVKVNEALWKLRGYPSEAEMIGLSDRDIHPQHLADGYIDEDRRVMNSGRPLENQIWLVPAEGKQLKWFVSSKIPLLGARGQVIGVAGVMRDLAKAASLIKPYREMDEAINHVLNHFAEPIEVADLAALVHLSVSQFERRFKRLYQMNPIQYVLRVRINNACVALSRGDESIAKVAQTCGFYDQSYFTKQFCKHLGQTPTAYRKRYQTPESPEPQPRSHVPGPLDMDPEEREAPRE